MKHEFTEYIPMQGTLIVRGFDPEGNLVFEDAGSNMIMEAAKSTLAHLIGGDGTGQSVTNIALGSDNTDPEPGGSTIGGIATDSLFTGENKSGDVLVAYLKSLASHTYPVPGRITFNWALDYGEANGLALSEFGLITSDQTLFARKTRGIIEKESDLALTGAWTIRF